MWKWLRGLDVLEVWIGGIVIVMIVTGVSAAFTKCFADPVITACEDLIRLLPKEQRLEGMAKCLDGADGKIDNAATKVGDL